MGPSGNDLGMSSRMPNTIQLVRKRILSVMGDVSSSLKQPEAASVFSIASNDMVMQAWQQS